jgi:class 3 adenylate cyclase
MERQSRTWLCSVVFLDIVGYTEGAVTQQIDMKRHLQDLIADAISEVPKSDRLMVDTGDGAALCFLGDPEEALFAALNLRDRLTNMNEIETPFTVRIGINLGPVKVLKNLSGQQNPLGDGINNAQRVMSFAKPNQILVSRSFYDVIACLSQEYAQLFQFLGTRKDKHIKEHAVYEVRLPDQEATYATAKAMTQLVDAAKEEELLALTWDPALLKTAERGLAPFVGPLAKVLVERAAQQATTPGELYKVLGGMIPDERELEQFLARVPVSEPHPAASAAAPPTPDAAKAERDSGPIPASWDLKVIKVAEQTLALYLGPLAKVLVKRAAKKTTDHEEFYRLLAHELSSREEQNAFLSAVRKAVSAS